MVHKTSKFVANVIEWDGKEETWKPPAGYTMVEDKDVVAGPGFTYKDGKFVPPPGGSEEA
jgi:hypothetical protein